MSVQKTNWILFRPLRGPEVCDARFFSTQSLPLGGRTVRGTVRSGPGEATINHRWAGEAGSDEGAILYPTFPCRKEGAPACRPNGMLLLPRWATRSPPHQSPSVTASPQGEASGLCSPTRRSVPNQGTQMGTEIGARPEQCGTTAKTSEWQRAGHKPRGGGGHPPATLCVRAFSRESLDPPPGTGRGTTLQVWTCAGPNRTTCQGVTPPRFSPRDMVR